jgi:hypothetical protein
MLQEMKNLLKFGLKLECLEIEFHILIKMKTGGQLEIQVLVDQIQKFFIGLVILNFHQRILMFEMMKRTGWKSGIMYLWNTKD